MLDFPFSAQGKYTMRWKPFLLIHLGVTLLFASWLWPVTYVYWHAADKAVFYFLNEAVDDQPLSQIFWAIANVRATDLIGAIFMAVFLLLFILDGKTAPERKERLTKMLFLCIWGELGILFAKEAVDAFIQKYQLLRDSPTVIYSDAVMLSDAVPWLKVKDFSRSCFPGDHAEIVIQWTIFVFALCGARYGFLALPASIFFVLPRFIGGAHWLSDAMVGSTSIALVVFAWAMFSPLHRYTMNLASWIVNKISLCIKGLQ